MIDTKRTWKSDTTIFAVCLLIGALIGIARGQSNFWDLINYHIYNPWALLHHREAKDIFVSGIQGYFDPFLDIPFYLASMVWFTHEPHLVAALEGLPFGALIFATLVLSRAALSQVLPKSGLLRKLVLGTVVMTAITGVSTWSQAISTSNEVLVGTLVLIAVSVLISSFGTREQEASRKSGLTVWQAALIGALLGLAPGLKLTAAVYAPAAGLVLLASCHRWKQLLACAITFFLAWLALFTLTYGPWALHLYEKTGNPFFPMFNNLFHSPLSAASGGRDVRDLPNGWIEWLFYPFFWLDDRIQTVFPFKFRDARFAAALVASCSLAITSLILWFRRRKTHNKPLLALAAFWLIGYTTWLAMFSMLRYAIVLEISATVIAAGVVLQSVNWLWRNRPDPGLVKLGAVGVMAALLMGFAVVPDMGYVAFGKQTFTSATPRLGGDALIILGNQPMGLLAPLIAMNNPDATFVGIPACFVKGDWCYNGFYNHGLGRMIRNKIARHKGPMYVAYYANRMPALPQLGLFGIAFDADHCFSMQTNRTSDVYLCPAYLLKTGIGSAFLRPDQYHLVADVRNLIPGANVTVTWKQNPCTDLAQPAVMKIAWSMPAVDSKVYVYISSRPSDKRKLFASGASSGEATTGAWASAAQDFFITDAHHAVLGELSLRYAPCKAKSN